MATTTTSTPFGLSALELETLNSQQKRVWRQLQAVWHGLNHLKTSRTWKLRSAWLWRSDVETAIRRTEILAVLWHDMPSEMGTDAAKNQMSELLGWFAELEERHKSLEKHGV